STGRRWWRSGGCCCGSPSPGPVRTSTADLRAPGSPHPGYRWEQHRGQGPQRLLDLVRYPGERLISPPPRVVEFVRRQRGRPAPGRTPRRDQGRPALVHRLRAQPGPGQLLRVDPPQQAAELPEDERAPGRVGAQRDYIPQLITGGGQHQVGPVEVLG